MQRKAKSGARLSVVRITIQATDWQDSGIGIVVARRPLTLLVPSHLIELVEQGQSHNIHVNGVPYEHAKILPTPALQRDYLSVLQFPKKHHRDLLSAHLPRRNIQLSPGQSISLQRLPSESSASGTVIDVREQGDGSSIITDIPVSTGDSGSPLLVSGKLAAVCQGMIQREGSCNAVAVPLSNDSLAELKKVSHRYRVSVFETLISLFIAVVLSLVGFAIYSSVSFTLAGIEVSEDRISLTATNAQAVTLNSSWTQSFDTPITCSSTFSSQVNGALDRIAVGTSYDNGIDGALHMFDSTGDILWSYSVPDGECIYSTTEAMYDGYLVDVIHIADLDEDGISEVVVSFVQNNFAPCKLLVFDLAGNILAEYWHPGYIRTIDAGRVGESNEMLLVISASNNALKTESWNPQTVFAFRGLDISGHAPPYDYQGAAERIDLSPGTEIWYQVIVNIDPTLMRAKCYQFEIGDYSGDGVNEIQAALTDGRFYYLNENGTQIRASVGDRFLKAFPDTEPPSLVDIWEYYESVKTARAAAEAGAGAEAADL
jgi:hypothetical protein